jgi:3-(3-hydroxy-phenyl)propionate hydroxylase
MNSFSTLTAIRRPKSTSDTGAGRRTDDQNLRNAALSLHPVSRPGRGAPVRHPVVVIGAGPIGLAAAIDLAQPDVPVVVVDDNDKVSWGSRAICFAKRPLEILDRSAAANRWSTRASSGTSARCSSTSARSTISTSCLRRATSARPSSICSSITSSFISRAPARAAGGRQAGRDPRRQQGHRRRPESGSRLDHRHARTAAYKMEADWLIACDGAGSPVRALLGLDFVGRVFEDNFLIADVMMKADFPTERWFWFDPPFNRTSRRSCTSSRTASGASICSSAGTSTRKKRRNRKTSSRASRQMLGDDVEFELEWVSIYTFQCRRMEKFRHGRVIFAGDSRAPGLALRRARRQLRRAGHRQPRLETEAGDGRQGAGQPARHL